MITDIQQAVDIYKRTQDQWVLKQLVRLIEVYVYRELLNSEDILEAKSDLNYVIYRTVTKYEPSKNIKFITYFWRSYKNFVIKEFHRKRIQRRWQGKRDVSLSDKMLMDGDTVEFYVPSNTRELEYALFQTDFSRVLQQIDDSKDAFIVMKLYEGYKASEIAVMLNTTKTTVYNRMSTLRTKSYGLELYELLKDCIAETTAQ